jgi:hypothetical protein
MTRELFRIRGCCHDPRMSLTADHKERMQHAHQSLDGCRWAMLGRPFLRQPGFGQAHDHGALAARPWRYSDDTVMALSIVEIWV